jgi:L-lactate dehydrogenase complex protein LldG
MPIASLSIDDRIARLKTCMEAIRSEVHVVGEEEWVGLLKSILDKRGVKSLLYGEGTWIDDSLKDAWEAGDPDLLPHRIPFAGPIEGIKETLFDIDAAITTTIGAIAETGAIVLWPDEKEPRTMSLVPPIHIAVVKAETIFNSFCEMIQERDWANHMPTNALLISGPSKTADIEMTLAFGVHGPKELIVLVLTGDASDGRS